MMITLQTVTEHLRFLLPRLKGRLRPLPDLETVSSPQVC
jgi:hypothetical protein